MAYLLKTLQMAQHKEFEKIKGVKVYAPNTEENKYNDDKNKAFYDTLNEEIDKECIICTEKMKKNERYRKK